MKKFDEYVKQLLHIDEPSKNRLIDLDAGDGAKTYYLSLADCENLSEFITLTALDRIGKPGNLVLRGSASDGGKEQLIGRGIKSLDWVCGDGNKDTRVLNRYIDAVYKDIKTKGNNPLFLSVAEIKMQARVSASATKTVRIPVLIYPIKLIRASSSSPITIEFVDDEVYLNPCLIEKLKEVLIGEKEFAFPHPNGETAGADEPISLDKLGDGNAYYEKVKKFVLDRSGANEETVFEFNRDTVAIAQYSHDDLCMYYDVKRNREKIVTHPVIIRLFAQNEGFDESNTRKVEPRFTRPYDSVQRDIISRVVSGENLIIKGPPGTGKTLTIANMISALLAENKKVLFASKKLAALDEVYNKIPDELKKFALLLDCESEATAAKINPSQVRKDLKELLLARETFKPSDEVYAKLNQATASASSALGVLNEYENTMFTEQTVGGVSYFDALDISAKYDLPVIEFVSDKTAQICPKELYLHTLDKVIECGKYFDEMTNNRSYSVKNNIFYGIKPDHDISAVISRLAPIGKIAEKLVALVSSLADGAGVSTEKLSLDTICALTSSALGDDERAKLIAYKDIEDIASRLSTALENYDKLPDADESIVELNDELPVLAQAVKSLKTDDALTVAQYRSIVKNSAIITEIKWTDELFNSLIKIVNDTDAQIKLSEEKLYNARAVIKKELSEKEEKVLIDGYDALGKYLTDNADKPKLFDLKAKSVLKKIEPLKIMQVSFAETVKAVAEYKDYKDAQSKIERNAYEVNRLFRAVLGDEQIALISQVVTRCRILGELPSDYVMRVLGEVKTIDKVVKLAPETATLAEIKQAVIKVNAKSQVLNALAYASKNADIFTSCELLTVDKARAINAFCFVISLSSGDAAMVEKYTAFAQKIADNRSEICSLINEFNSLNIEFSKEFYPTEFTKRDITLPAVLQYSLDYDKINKATDALNFVSVMQGEIFPIDKFFDLLNIDNQGKELSYGERFEHTFYSLASRAKKNEIGKALGNEIDVNREKYRDGIKRLEQSNIELIENMLMKRIDLADPDYAFLQKENDQSALRLTFSAHARAILKLKPCMILSPSSVSVLMRPQDYENFDCVIVDEASQLEPVSALPSLFRARSCVIVGDEWQMPPISHFKLRVETPDEELEPSLLALALESKAFRAEELKCHYRSETESLIRFSQARYYDGMKTFPAQTPKTETLGFNDIFVSDGCCEHGVNLAEAKTVVDIIADNFEKYYKDGKLTRTLGIVAFGESQIEKIKSLAKADTRLKKFRHNPDDESAGCFYRTIEKVQGQEATDMILSLTYGKRADGSVNQSFAELNRGKLGECIFNVAVTRAKQSVTVIHSILPEQIDNERISFIADYLRISARFSQNGKEQFVSNAVNKGFVASVADYIVSLGIARERVVTDYGVTAGSVRIPIAVLAPDLSQAECGIWCERDHGNEYDYIDLTVRHYESLLARGWKLLPVYAHDWTLDRADAQQRIKKFIESVSKGE